MPQRPIMLIAILVCTSAMSLVWAIREKSQANAMEDSRNQMEDSRNQLKTSLSAARAEIQTLSSQLEAAAKPAAGAPDPPPPVQPPTRSVPAVRRRAAPLASQPKNTDEPRWKRVESQLAVHQTQLADHRERITQTQEDVRRTGVQLDNKISSTRDELNRSIDKTSDDVVLLQKRGERSIYEFDLTKSKEFHRVGPLSLSLRKADTKHRSYDITFMVDDKPVEKQHVNLAEPVWISLAELPQPIEVVVNQIDKNHVRGYISAPRYKTADLAGAPAPGPVQPAFKSR